MARILANDGIAEDGKEVLEQAGHTVDTEKIAQDELADGLKAYEGVIVRSATKITRDIIDANPQLKVVGRAGVGLDNIDVNYAREKGIEVLNTPAASSLSVAELVFAHIFTVSRKLHLANRELPAGGEFKALKKKYSKGGELRGKVLGIMGLGRIGQEVAKIAISLGMNVVAHDPSVRHVYLVLDHLPVSPTPEIVIESTTKEEVLERADFITFHVPFKAGSKPLLDREDFDHLKEGSIIVNCARGGVVSEEALLDAMNSGRVTCAGLDVFESEPTIREELLRHENVSLSPHIGGSTVEAQQRIGIEIAEKVKEYFEKEPVA